MAHPLNSPSPAPRLLSLPARAVDVASIERELAQLWRDAQAHPAGDGMVTRACMSNLIIVCTAEQHASVIAEEIGAIVQLHPARVLLLVAGASDLLADIEAYVSAHCHLTGNGRQICSEHVAVSARRGAIRRLPSVVRALLIGDLPTSLWWAAAVPPAPGDVLFDELAAMAAQLIYDTTAWPDPIRALVATARWAATPYNGLALADLAWRQLEPWRRLISQTLDPALVAAALQSIDEVVVEHGPHGQPYVSYLLGWLAACLGWQLSDGASGSMAEWTWTFRAADRPVRVTARHTTTGDAGLNSVAITWRGTTAHFASSGGDQLKASIDAAQRVLVAPSLSRARRVAEQLPHLERDPLFHNVLAIARAMVETIAHE